MKAVCVGSAVPAVEKHPPHSLVCGNHTHRQVVITHHACCCQVPCMVVLTSLPTATHSLLLLSCRVLSCVLACAGLLAEVEAKAAQPEYGQLLQDCRNVYCSIRQQVGTAWHTQPAWQAHLTPRSSTPPALMYSLYPSTMTLPSR